ncbi:hypothetical protein [Ammoniphilus sp. 3BR4]|uniref:hypothetical protein n=1 Tax=Ammoniphilus sp. 3BR4 TaxID=3158265 RepID=UPI0034658228
MDCRYREVSPVCVGKHRELRPEEATKEHLIPRYLMRDPKFKAKWGITFLPSEEPNVDISCHKCNHLKNHMADVPFVWKLNYLNKYGVILKSKRSIERTIRFQQGMDLSKKEKELALQCIQRGNFEWVKQQVAQFLFHHTTVVMEEGVIVEFLQSRKKVPRKKKKESL